MCNFMHNDSVPIKKSGKGWKIFEKPQLSWIKLKPMAQLNARPYPINESIIWEDYLFQPMYDQIENKNEKGFCFFLTRKEAQRCFDDWVYNHNCIIRRIEYKQGLGKHNENGISGSHLYYLVALTKEFKILPIKGDKIM